MKKYSKAGLLIITLVIPALIFTFLRFFATNHYNIPYYFPITEDHGKVKIVDGDTLFYKVERFSATGSDGKAIAQDLFAGKLTVVNYLPKHCGDSCQVLQNSLERIYSLRDKVEALRLLTVSSNAKDIASFSERVGWAAISVLPDKLNDILLHTFRFDTSVPKAKTNSMESKLLLIDTESHIRGYYNGYDPEEINRLMAEIKILDFEKKEGSRN